MSKDAKHQFGQQAAFYASSQTHSQGESLQILKDLANLQGDELVVDIGTGPGFTAFALAQTARQVIATDLALPMLQHAQQIRAAGESRNVHLALAAGGHLPFKEASIDLVTCRLAYHHFKDLSRAIKEAFRVLKTGGAFVIADTVSPENDQVARWLNDVELRRDPSHIHDLKVSEWNALLTAQNFTISNTTMTRTDLELNDWTLRSNTPKLEVAKLKEDFLSASDEVATEFRIKPHTNSINFSWNVAVIRAIKPPS